MTNTEDLKQNKKPEETQVVSARITKSLLDRLRNKHPNKGDTNKVISALLERYLDGKVLGVHI